MHQKITGPNLIFVITVDVITLIFTLLLPGYPVILFLVNFIASAVMLSADSSDWKLFVVAVISGIIAEPLDAFFPKNEYENSYYRRRNRRLGCGWVFGTRRFYTDAY